MLSRLEVRNESSAIQQKEAELLRDGFHEVDPDDLPEPKEYRKFSYAGTGAAITHVIEWADEIPVGCGIPMHG